MELRFKHLFVYTAMLVAAVAVFFVIQYAGESMHQVRGEVAPVVASESGSSDVLLHVLLAFAVVIVVTRAVGVLVARFRQPAVIGEVLGGILLGPSFLGMIAPEAASYILPAEVAPYLGVLSQFGIILYMFLVGLHLDLGMIQRSVQATIAISHASIVLPFVLGSLVSLILYASYAGDGVSFTVFALFMGVSMSVTAFPVLARILTDSNVQKTRLGTIALTCAAIDDVTAWCLLALVVGVAGGRPSDAAASVVFTIVFVVVMFRVAKPLLNRWIPRIDVAAVMERNTIAVVLVAMLLCALATEYIGIQAIFGAFLLGAIVPHESRLAVEIRKRLEDIVTVLLLPAFFAFTGMRTEIGRIEGLEQWLICGLIIVVASAGKFGGTILAARLTGIPWRASSALGVLMNTRGLVELIVLNIGLDLGVISPTLFTMLLIMALVTTFATGPLLHLIMRNRQWDHGTVEHRIVAHS